MTTPNLKPEDLELLDNMIPAVWYYSISMTDYYSLTRLVDAGLVETKSNPTRTGLAYKRKPKT